MFYVPLTARSYRDVDHGLKSHNERLEKPGIELMTPGLQGEEHYHYTTEALFPNISYC